MKRRQFIFNSGLLASGFLSMSAMPAPNVQTKLKPQVLKYGDTIALTAPAGAIFSPTYIDKIANKLKSLGFKTKSGQTLTKQEGYLAGSDQLRAEEINGFFKDQSVKAIFTLRGGWGCGRILHLIDYQAIKNNPKIIMGFSDITSLLVAITKQTGLITFHGPMGYSSWNKFSTQQVYSTIVEGKRTKFTNPPEEIENLKTLTPGIAKGEILAGNLTVICSLIGTPYEPSWTGKILCLEEIGEEPYRIDRMLWQLKSCGALNAVSAVVLGSFKKCEPEFPEESFSLTEVIEQYFKDKKVPAFSGASFGHVKNKFNLPVGANAVIDARTFKFELTESPAIFNG